MSEREALERSGGGGGTSREAKAGAAGGGPHETFGARSRQVRRKRSGKALAQRPGSGKSGPHHGTAMGRLRARINTCIWASASLWAGSLHIRPR